MSVYIRANRRRCSRPVICAWRFKVLKGMGIDYKRAAKKDGAGATLNQANYYAVPSHPFLQRITPVRTVPPAYVANQAYPMPMRPNPCIRA